MGFTPPKIIKCSDWGARTPTTKPRELSWKAVGIVVHHTVTANTSDVSQDQAFRLALSIQADHINRGYGDSGQHFTISRGGFILEARHGSLDSVSAGTTMIQGAHTYGGPGKGMRLYNDELIGIENEGNYELETPPSALFDSLVLLCAWICQQYGISAQKITGHRILNATACPGKHLFGQLDSLRKSVSDLISGQSP
jgi:hypothetical protein